jgi:cell division protein FtsZ
MTLNLTIPQQMHTDFTPRITVIGVGGGGTNAVDNMIALDLQGVEFVVANTDAQQLMHSRADRRIQLGPHITQGLGAGAKPEIGRAAAEEAADELYRHLDGTHMVFITAGMGGGTGTGAAPVIARMARERNILTVGVVTKPFTFEGSRRARTADQGIEELQQFVDTLIVIPNQNLFRLANEHTGWREAFKMADNVLYMGVRGVTDLMVAPGLVNLDFADIRTVMAEMGKAMMGTGEADGENRAIRAAEAAISNPLLEDTSMAGARGLLINITGGEDMTLFEVDQAANRIREEVDEEANIIFGSAIDETLNGKIRVSVVATGIDTPAQATAERPRLVAVGGTDAPANLPGTGQAAIMGIVTAPPVGTTLPSIGRPSGAGVAVAAPGGAGVTRHLPAATSGAGRKPRRHRRDAGDGANAGVRIGVPWQRGPGFSGRHDGAPPSDQPA